MIPRPVYFGRDGAPLPGPNGGNLCFKYYDTGNASVSVLCHGSWHTPRGMCTIQAPVAAVFSSPTTARACRIRPESMGRIPTVPPACCYAGKSSPPDMPTLMTAPAARCDARSEGWRWRYADQTFTTTVSARMKIPKAKYANWEPGTILATPSIRA